VAEPRLYLRGRVWWTWWNGADGARIQLSTGCRDRKAARERALQLERDFVAAGGVRPREALTLKDACATELEHLREAGRAEATIRAATYHARHLIEVLAPDTPLIRIDHAACVQYAQTRLKQGASKHTTRKEVGFLEQTHRRCAKLALFVPTTPADALMPDLLEGHYVPRERWLTRAEFTKLRAQLALDRVDYVDALVHLGVRWGELLSLTADNYDAKSRTLRVAGTKTARSKRSLPANTTAHEILTRRADQAPAAGALFAPWGSARRDIHRACERAGVEPCGPHDLRRTCAQWMLDAGVPERTIADWLGHTTTTLVRNTYAQRIAIDALRDAANHLVR
jgi:integrase